MNFLQDKSVLITGSTGQLGKVVLEKILRSFPLVKKVYLGIKVKGGPNATGDAYDRYKSEIKDSQIFDQLKIKLGMTATRKMLRKKIVLVPMDLARPDLGLSKQMREELQGNLHHIVNCAGIVDFDVSLDVQVGVNVAGPLQLMKLAEECRQFEVFAQVSTTFAVCEKTGFIDEKLYHSAKHDWSTEFNKICQMGREEITETQSALIRKFPNNYCYSKRMAEEMLILNQKSQVAAGGRAIPLVLLRPSIMAASLAEPVPGWTDNLGFLGGFHAMGGYGILRDLPLNPKLIGDQIPVDIVCNQLLASLAVCLKQYHESSGKNALLLTHSCSSASNGVTWGDTISFLEAYWHREPLANAVGVPQLTAHSDAKSYERAFRLKALPTNAYYQFSRFLGTKAMAKKGKEARDALDQCRKIGIQFNYFMNNEWIFDNASTGRLQKELLLIDPSGELLRNLNFDVSKIKWKQLVQNHGYGIKRYILQEEAYMPSMGYADARGKMYPPILPFQRNQYMVEAFQKKIIPFEETLEIVFSTEWVKQELQSRIEERFKALRESRGSGYVSKTSVMLTPDQQRDKIAKEVRQEAAAMLKRIYSDFTMEKLNRLISILQMFFKKSYKKLIVDELQIEKLKQLFTSRKGPIIFAPTHRSYVDFLVVTSILYFYGIEIPLICAGEDFIDMPVIGNVLRGSGAFFMRRTFRGDGLYKAVFYEYVRLLNKDRQVMEFFIEGTRSRTNKMLQPKYGFMSVCTRTFFQRDVEEITIVPVTLNYTATLEGESFPGELRGEQKVKETTGRVLKGADVLLMDFGTMMVDFCDPIQVSEYTSNKMKSIPNFDPFNNRKDQLMLNEMLAHSVVNELQKNIRIMPTTIVASLIMLYRKGITKMELAKKTSWLGMVINDRGASFGNVVGLPGSNTMSIGLEHLKNYLNFKGDMIEPKVTSEDQLGNYIMLYYYRNPVIYLFHNESLILAAMQSFGLQAEWQSGVNVDALYERTVFLSKLLEQEEYIQKRIVKDNRDVFDEVIEFMISSRILMEVKEKTTNGQRCLVLRTSGESQIVFIKSLIYPMIDSYYVALVYILTFVKNKGIDTVSFAKNVQWLAELLFKQGAIQFFESCNQESIKNAMSTFIGMGILTKTGKYVELNETFQEDEGKVVEILEYINTFRQRPNNDVLSLNDPKQGLFRRSMLAQFPFMAKL